MTRASTCADRLAVRLAAIAVVLNLSVPGGCRREEPDNAPPTVAQQVAEQVVPADQSPPAFVFPPEVRAKNESLNAFLEEFQQVCANGEYLRYRGLVSRQVEPLDKDRFVAAWHAVDQVTIRLIRRLPRLESLPDPAYGVLVHVLLHDSAQLERRERNVALMVFREPDEKQQERWVMAPAPEPIREALREAAGLGPAVTAPPSTAPGA